MKNKFDELTKGLAQSVTRRQAFKRFGVGLAGIAMACFGLANKADAGKVDFCTPTGGGCYKGGWPCCHGGCHVIGTGGFGICKG